MGNNANAIQEFSYIVLVIIPFICSYIDFQYYHGLSKIFVISHFIRSCQKIKKKNSIIQDYEQFIEEIRNKYAPKLFGFEGKAQVGSSILLSAIGPLLGIPLALSARNNLFILCLKWQYIGIILLFLSAIFGVIFVWKQYNTYKKELQKAKDVFF
ncbi:MAG: hypothetical protein JXB88_00890 [Spirochaetales bacterium]|nr:hypothetical protein [Spirochaetales bacterium]